MSVRVTRSGKSYTPVKECHKFELKEKTNYLSKKCDTVCQNILQRCVGSSPVPSVKSVKQNNCSMSIRKSPRKRMLTFEDENSFSVKEPQVESVNTKTSSPKRSSHCFNYCKDYEAAAKSPRKCFVSLVDSNISSMMPVADKQSFSPLSPKQPSQPLSRSHFYKSPRKRVLMFDNANVSPVKEILKSKEPLTFSPKRLNHSDSHKEDKSPRARVLTFESKVLINEKSEDKENKHFAFSPRRPTKVAMYNQVKSSLNHSVPKYLVGRDAEITEITSFINDHALSNTSGSMYISGAPGTGKTACLLHILSKSTLTVNNIKKHVAINCMAVRTAAQIYQKLAVELGATSKHLKSSRTAQRFIEAELSNSNAVTLIVLDEIDQLDCKHQDVLYTMFGWPLIKDSKIILIGIANSLDLTDRILPRLQANLNCKPKLINFKPYSKDQLVAILQSRLNKASPCEEQKTNVIDPMAVQFCARKVAAMTGDARKALDVCRRAVEMLEIDDRKHADFDDTKVSSQKVGLKEISNIMSGVYKSASICNEGEEDADQGLPLQQKLLVCTLLLLSKKTKNKEISLGMLHDSYISICKKRHVTAVNQSEFFSLSELVESRGLISVKKAKLIRQTKIKLNIQEKEVESAIEGRTLLSSILQSGL